MNNIPKVESVKFLLIYVDKLEPCQKFYETYLGFEKTAEFRPGEIFGNLGDLQMWMGAGYDSIRGDEKSTRATAMIGVDSVGMLYQNLKADQQKVIQEAPIEMQEGVYWLQFVDPAGNVLDVLGGA